MAYALVFKTNLLIDECSLLNQSIITNMLNLLVTTRNCCLWRWYSIGNHIDKRTRERIHIVKSERSEIQWSWKKGRNFLFKRIWILAVASNNDKNKEIEKRMKKGTRVIISTNRMLGPKEVFIYNGNYLIQNSNKTSRSVWMWDTCVKKEEWNEMCRGEYYGGKPKKAYGAKETQ